MTDPIEPEPTPLRWSEKLNFDDDGSVTLPNGKTGKDFMCGIAGVGDAVEGIKNRQIIGYSKYGASNSVDATLQELMATTPMRLLGFTEEQAAAATEAMEGVAFTTLPEGLIPGSEAILVPRLDVFFLTRTGVMDDETAYGVARSIHQHMDLLIEAWPQLADYDIAADALATIEAGIPYHPGAVRYWKEAAGS